MSGISMNFFRFFDTREVGSEIPSRETSKMTPLNIPTRVFIVSRRRSGCVRLTLRVRLKRGPHRGARFIQWGPGERLIYEKQRNCDDFSLFPYAYNLVRLISCTLSPSSTTLYRSHEVVSPKGKAVQGYSCYAHARWKFLAQFSASS